MSVSNLINTAGPFATDGVVTDFSFNFVIQNKSQLAVFRFAANGAVSLVPSGEYDIILDPQPDSIEPSSMVVFSTAPDDGQTLYIVSDYEATQDVEFESQGGFFPDIYERAFDKLTYLIQQINTRTLQFPQHVERTLENNAMPAPREGFGIKYNADGGVEEENVSNNLKRKDVTGDNTMEVPLNMGFQPINNLPKPILQDDPIRLRDFRNAVLGEYGGLGGLVGLDLLTEEVIIKLNLFEENAALLVSQRALIDGLNTDLADAVTTFDLDVTNLQGSIAGVISTVNADRTTTSQGFVDIADRVELVEDDVSQTASSVLLLSNAFNNPTTGLPATRALVFSQYSTTTEVDSAIATGIEALEATIFNEDGTTLNNAFIGKVDVAVASVTGGSIASSLATLSSSTTSLQNQLDTSNANISNNLYTKTEADSAIAVSTTSLSAQIFSGGTLAQGFIDSINSVVVAPDGGVNVARVDALQADVEDNAAAIIVAQTAIATESTARATSISTLTASLGADITAAAAIGSAAQVDADGNASSITSLQNRVTINEQDVTAAEILLGTTVGRVTGVEGDIVTVTGDIQALEDDIITVVSSVASVASTASLANTTANSALNLANTAVTRVSGAEDDITIVSNSLASVSSTATSASGTATSALNLANTTSTRVTEVESDIVTVGQDITGLEGTVSTLTSSVATISSVANSAQGDATSALSLVNTANTNINGLTDDVFTINSSLASVSAVANNAQGVANSALNLASTATTDISNIEGEISSILSSVASLGTEVDSAQGDASSALTLISTANTNISNIVGDLSDATGDITGIQGDLITLNSSLATITGTANFASQQAVAALSLAGTAGTDIDALEARASLVATTTSGGRTRVAGMTATSNSSASKIDFVGDAVRFLRDDGTAAVQYNTVTDEYNFDGTLIGSVLRSGAIEMIRDNQMHVISPSPFGPDNLVEWKGPVNSTTTLNGAPRYDNLTISNATIYWETLDNRAAFGGATRPITTLLRASTESVYRTPKIHLKGIYTANDNRVLKISIDYFWEQTQDPTFVATFNPSVAITIKRLQNASPIVGPIGIPTTIDTRTVTGTQTRTPVTGGTSKITQKIEWVYVVTDSTDVISRNPEYILEATFLYPIPPSQIFGTGYQSIVIDYSERPPLF